MWHRCVFKVVCDCLGPPTRQRVTYRDLSCPSVPTYGLVEFGWPELALPNSVDLLIWSDQNGLSVHVCSRVDSGAPGRSQFIMFRTHSHTATAYLFAAALSQQNNSGGLSLTRSAPLCFEASLENRSADVAPFHFLSRH